MLYLPASVVCSVTLAVLLKLARRHGVDVRQAILTNYAVACVLCLTLLRPDLNQLLHLPMLPVLAALGLLLPSIFVALAQSVRHAGIVKTDAAQRLSLFIALGAAFVLFGEPVTARKAGAIALACAALFCLLRKPAQRDDDGGATWIWPLVVWVGYGVIDILFKIVARAGAAFSATLLGAFALAGILMLLWLLWRRAAWRGRDLAAGLLLGMVNFGNIYTYIRAHQSLPDQPALVFASMNMGVIALGTAAGAWLFSEKLSATNITGLVLALGAIAVMLP
nr:EamA/RhaT family transporter [Bordetella holmesii]